MSCAPFDPLCQSPQPAMTGRGGAGGKQDEASFNPWLKNVAHQVQASRPEKKEFDVGDALHATHLVLQTSNYVRDPDFDSRSFYSPHNTDYLMKEDAQMSSKVLAEMSAIQAMYPRERWDWMIFCLTGRFRDWTQNTEQLQFLKTEELQAMLDNGTYVCSMPQHKKEFPSWGIFRGHVCHDYMVKLMAKELKQ